MYPVKLYLYDLSEGWCKNLGPLCPVSAVWHTSIIIYNKEYYFGFDGIKFQEPGAPSKVLELGETNVEPWNFKVYVKGLKYSTWTYDPINHNCNHFTDHLAKFLQVTPIPQYIFDSVEKLIKSPFYAKIIEWATKNAQNREKHTK